MAQNLRDFYASAQTEPVLTTIGRGVRPMASALQERDQIKKTLPALAGALANQAPKVLGVPAAGIANAASRGIADFQTGFTGQKYRPQQFEAKSFTDLFASQKPAAAPLAAPPAGLPRFQRPETTYTPGAGLPSAAQVASDKARASTAQAASDMRLSAQPGVSRQPTNIGVRRQANGVLEFSGQGGGDGTGAVSYSGLPNWTSAQGGAGQGAADFGGQAFKPAQAAVAQTNRDNASGMTEYKALADKIGRGVGGAVGVAQNKAQLAALAPMIERQMANENAMGVAKLGAETTRRGQDQGLKGEMARVGATNFGTTVGAQTAAADREVEQEKIQATLLAAWSKAAAGKPLNQIEQLGLEIFEGKQFKGNPVAQKKAMQDWILMFKGGNPFEQAMAEQYANMQGGQ